MGCSFNFGQLVSLGRIEIGCASVYYDAGVPVKRRNPYAIWLPHQLRSFGPANVIEAIQFELAYNTEDEVFQEREFWLLIDQLLADQTRFPRLHLISIKRQVDDVQDFDYSLPSLGRDFFSAYRASGRGFRVFDPM